MVSTRQPSQAEQVASSAQARADGGSIFADAPNAVTSAAVTAHQVSMRRNISPLRGTRLSRVSSRASGGFTTIVQGNPSLAQNFPLLTRIRRINRRPDQPERCLQTGKRCFTNRRWLFGSAASHAVRSRRHKAPRLRIRPVRDSAVAASASSTCGFAIGEGSASASARRGGGYTVTRSFVVICTAALIVALVLAGMTSVYFYLAVVAAEAPKCARLASSGGHAIGLDELGILPLVSVVIVVMVAALGRGKRVRDVLKNNDLPVLEFASMSITLGMSVIYSTIFVALVMLGLFTRTSATHYDAIVKYCLAATAIPPSNVIATISLQHLVAQQGVPQNG